MRAPFPLLAACMLALCGCPAGRDGGTVAGRAAKAGILIINNAADPVSLDPQAVSGAVDLRIVSALFEGLLAHDPVTLAPVPAAARSHTLSPDGLVCTLRLRPNLRWSDGTPLTAKDFLFSWERILSPRLGAPNATLLFCVKNARAFYEGRVRNFSDTGFSAPDPLTLRLELEHPTPTLPALLCHAAWAPVPRHAILAKGGADTPGTPWTRPGSIVTNGPFLLAGWSAGDRIELARNPHYHAAASVRLNGVRFLTITDAAAEERAFRGGLLHITSSVPPVKVPPLRARHDPALRLDPFFSTTFIRVNTGVPPLNDVRVRRALSLALDRWELAGRVLRAGEIPARSLVPDGTAGYAFTPETREAGIPERADASTARRLLAEAGYPGGADFPVLTYLYNNQESSQLLAQAMQQMWRDVLGIRVELQSRDWKVFKQEVAAGKYQLARAAWSGDYPDPASFLELFTSTSELNQTRWKSAGYDEAIAEAARAHAGPGRNARFRHAENLLLRDAAIIPVVHNRNKFLIHPRVRNWHPNPLDIHPLQSVDFADKMD